jgi:hypothetical protein
MAAMMGVSHVLQQLLTTSSRATHLATLRAAWCRWQLGHAVCTPMVEMPAAAAELLRLLSSLRTLRPYLLLNRPQA